MKAALLKKTGPSEEFRDNIIIEDVPVPEIKDNEVLINIKFAALNHRDVWIAKGAYPGINLPVILGSDCAGIIHSTGSSVSNFKAGDEVIINPGFNWGSNENFQSKDFKILGMPDNGTLAEFISVSQSYIYKKPSHLNFTQAAGIPLTGITAYRALFNKALLKKGDNLLIPGIGGGVSSSALVFAVSTGANVYVTSGSEDKIKKAVSLGAKGGANYKNDNWDKEILEMSGNNINVVIDGEGGDTFSKCMELINYGGRIVCYGSTSGRSSNIPMARLFWKQLKIYGSTMGSSDDFAEMVNFINDNKIVPVIDEVFPLDNISEAFLRMNKGKQFGKIVVSILDF